MGCLILGDGINGYNSGYSNGYSNVYDNGYNIMGIIMVNHGSSWFSMVMIVFDYINDYINDCWWLYKERGYTYK